MPGVSEQELSVTESIATLQKFNSGVERIAVDLRTDEGHHLTGWVESNGTGALVMAEAPTPEQEREASERSAREATTGVRFPDDTARTEVANAPNPLGEDLSSLSEEDQAKVEEQGLADKGYLPDPRV